jgi:thioredoxin-related protein
MQNMQRLPDWLRIPLNQYGFLTVPLVPVFLIVVLLGLDGFSVTDFVIIGLVLVLLGILWSRTHARQTTNVPTSNEDLMQSIKSSGKYAMLALESEYCLSSTNVGKRLIDLETSYPNDFQIYALSIFKTPGKELYESYKCRVTPTYVLIDPEGKVVMEYPLVLPVERVSYAITQKLENQSSA